MRKPPQEMPAKQTGDKVKHHLIDGGNKTAKKMLPAKVDGGTEVDVVPKKRHNSGLKWILKRGFSPLLLAKFPPCLSTMTGAVTIKAITKPI